MTPLFGVVMVLAAVGFTVLFGLTDEAFRRMWRRRHARNAHPYYEQATHCRVVDQRQEIRTR